MDLSQKIVLWIGALLIFLRCVFPVRYPFPHNRIDLTLTMLHIIGIVVVSAVLFFTLKDATFKSIGKAVKEELLLRYRRTVLRLLVLILLLILWWIVIWRFDDIYEVIFDLIK
jgi:hypothetical protein